jgi:hypothetical protein
MVRLISFARVMAWYGMALNRDRDSGTVIARVIGV